MLDRVEKEVDLLERHLSILRLILENEPIGIVNIADRTGYPHHKVRYSMRVLEEEGLIDPTSQGAVTTDATEEFLVEFNERIDTVIEQVTTGQWGSEAFPLEE